ncbi:hypothetical protein B0T17DRAFT_506250 [Bombardia bombarda]|uniref:Replication protein A 32 kDa subunit n=1 Tax=Bombardia bombarda TaxID=252184 RepID=A0AA39XA89_9PEZI|nr:hypothetical protein B0T17DRAFT_506250 [Bombardia bombarda]
MASYGGGYTKTSYGAQGGDDGGGFMGASQQGSQAGGSKSYSDDSLRPVTIKQLVDCEEAYPGADLGIDGVPITQVTLVGQVRTANPQATNVTYQLDDGTALMDVKKWVDAEKSDDDNNADPKFAPGTYVRVWGRLKSFNGKKHVGAHFIRAIDDFNEVNYHLLEATYSHLYFTKGVPQQQANGGDAGGDSMFVDNGYAGTNAAAAGTSGAGNEKLAGCTRNARVMYDFINNSPGGNEGLHLNQIASGTGLSVRDVLSAADELLGNGVVYTTIDDETWAILDY